MHPTKFVDPKAEDIISKLSQDETGKRQYYRPVYSLHKWWARRPGALFRSIILHVAQPNQNHFEFNGNGSISSKSNYFDSHDLQDIVVFDPFMGGGTTLVEANRLGAKIIGCDLNPVSYWVVKETLKPIDLKKLANYFDDLENSTGSKIKSLYKTRCLKCNRQADTMYSFWIRYVQCLHCGKDAHLFKRCLLNKGLSRTKPPSSLNPATTFCPNCFKLNHWNGEGDCECENCKQSYNPQIGTYDKGFYSCSNCHKTGINLINTLKNGQSLKEKLISIEYLCPCDNNRTYKVPDAEDLARIVRIEETVKLLQSDLTIPNQQILEGASSARWINHNYKYYHEVFNSRQLLAFHYLIEGIRKIPEQEYQYAFITAFTNSLEYNNMMTPYNYPHRKLHHLFNYHAMPLTTMPVENAVWGVGTEGAGTFVNCFLRYVKAKKYCQKPFDKFKDSSGNVYTIASKREKIEANIVTSFEELKSTIRGAMLFCNDSSKLPLIPDKSVDFVITDPPYFDSIHYSELSNFFYVWLKSIVENENFSKEHVPTESEAIVNQGMNKGELEYQALLASVFKESKRVLKDAGKLIFTFHHTKWRAWWTILNALTISGFEVIDSFPVMSEYKVNPHIRNKQSLDMDLVLVCQKQSSSRPELSPDPTEVLHRAIQDINSIGDNSDNKLFLHFMGELLRTASSIQNRSLVNYDWFSESLTHFDDFLETIERTKLDSKYTAPKPRQLRLLEEDDEL